MVGVFGSKLRQTAALLAVLLLAMLWLLTFVASGTGMDPPATNTNTNTATSSPGTSGSGAGQPGTSGSSGQPGGSAGPSVSVGSASQQPSSSTTTRSPAPQKKSTGTQSSNNDPVDVEPFVDPAAAGLPQPTANLTAGPAPAPIGTGDPPVDANAAADSSGDNNLGKTAGAVAVVTGLAVGGAALTKKPPEDLCLGLSVKLDSAMEAIAGHRNFLRSQIASARKFDSTDDKIEALQAQLDSLDRGEGPLNDKARDLAGKMTAAGCDM